MLGSSIKVIAIFYCYFFVELVESQWQKYYYKWNGESFDIVLADIPYLNYKEIKSPKTYKISYSHRGDRPGVCLPGEFNCGQTYDLSETWQFECTEDFQCPRPYKCCSVKCFRHKVCQPAKPDDFTEEPPSELNIKTSTSNEISLNTKKSTTTFTTPITTMISYAPETTRKETIQTEQETASTKESATSATEITEVEIITTEPTKESPTDLSIISSTTLEKNLSTGKTSSPLTSPILTSESYTTETTQVEITIPQSVTISTKVSSTDLDIRSTTAQEININTGKTPSPLTSLITTSKPYTTQTTKEETIKPLLETISTKESSIITSSDDLEVNMNTGKTSSRLTSRITTSESSQKETTKTQPTNISTKEPPPDLDITTSTTPEVNIFTEKTSSPLTSLKTTSKLYTTETTNTEPATTSTKEPLTDLDITSSTTTVNINTGEKTSPLTSPITPSETTKIQLETNTPPEELPAEFNIKPSTNKEISHNTKKTTSSLISSIATSKSYTEKTKTETSTSTKESVTELNDNTSTNKVTNFNTKETTNPSILQVTETEQEETTKTQSGTGMYNTSSTAQQDVIENVSHLTEKSENTDFNTNKFTEPVSISSTILTFLTKDESNTVKIKTAEPEEIQTGTPLVQSYSSKNTLDGLEVIYTLSITSVSAINDKKPKEYKKTESGTPIISTTLSTVQKLYSSEGTANNKLTTESSNNIKNSIIQKSSDCSDLKSTQSAAITETASSEERSIIVPESYFTILPSKNKVTESHIKEESTTSSQTQTILLPSSQKTTTEATNIKETLYINMMEVLDQEESKRTESTKILEHSTMANLKTSTKKATESQKETKITTDNTKFKELTKTSLTSLTEYFTNKPTLPTKTVVKETTGTEKKPTITSTANTSNKETTESQKKTQTTSFKEEKLDHVATQQYTNTNNPSRITQTQQSEFTDTIRTIESMDQKLTKNPKLTTNKAALLSIQPEDISSTKTIESQGAYTVPTAINTESKKSKSDVVPTSTTIKSVFSSFQIEPSTSTKTIEYQKKATTKPTKTEISPLITAVFSTIKTEPTSLSETESPMVLNREYTTKNEILISKITEVHKVTDEETISKTISLNKDKIKSTTTSISNPRIANPTEPNLASDDLSSVNLPATEKSDKSDNQFTRIDESNKNLYGNLNGEGIDISGSGSESGDNQNEDDEDYTDDYYENIDYDQNYGDGSGDFDEDDTERSDKSVTTHTSIDESKKSTGTTGKKKSKISKDKYDDTYFDEDKIRKVKPEKKVKMDKKA